MDAQVRTQVAFHLTARRPEESPAPSEWRKLRPALLAAYRELSSLRYDFPVVLVDDGDDWVRSLSSIVDRLLQKIAPRGVEGERVRRHVLRLEQEIRRLAADGRSGLLSALWREASEHLREDGGAAMAESLELAGGAHDADGEVADCDAELPVRLTQHAWRITQGEKVRRLRADVERLRLKLSDILKADFVRSEGGRSLASLQAAMGPVFAEEFDFAAMSRVLAPASEANALSISRRRRIEWALATLSSPPFLKPKSNGASEHGALDAFVFESCSAAMKAFRDRLPDLIEFLKAVAVAELEIEGRYVEQEHDRLLADLDEGAIGAADLDRFPDYLVCIRQGAEEETAAVMDVLASGLPVKVLVQTDDILGARSLGDGAFAQGGARLASMAIGLNDVYVLQSASANLYALREELRKGLAYRGATLISVFSGASGTDLPPYLNAAAAMQSRAFPAFTYDPSAGTDLAARFSLATNPQPEADWASAELTYEEEGHQRARQALAFTYVDFLACDAR